MAKEEYELEDEYADEAFAEAEDVISVDFSKADLVPENGYYTIEVSSSTLKKSKAGNPMILVGLEVVGDEEGNENAFTGCHLFDNFMLTGGRIRITGEALKALMGHIPEPGQWRASDLLGLQAVVELEQDEDEQYGIQARVAHWIS
jgi:hypothetical protein